MKRILAVLLALVLVIGMMAGCSSNSSDAPADNTDKKEKEFVTIVTGGSSGAYFALGGALSNLLNEKLDYVNSSVESTGASAVNATKVGNNEAELAFAMNNVVSFAYNGVEGFKEKGKVENLRAVASLYPNYVQLVTVADSGIETVEDLVGKRVGVGAPGSGTEVDARNILKVHGITYDDINEDFLSYAEAIEQIKNGTVDAAFLTSGIPNAAVLDLSTTGDCKIVPITAEKVAELAETIPFYSSSIIPGGMYDDENDVATAAVSTLLITSAEVSEDTIYDITKTLFENLDSMVATHNAAKNINLETFEVGIPVPFHPGAERYYREVGVIE